MKTAMRSFAIAAALSLALPLAGALEVKVPNKSKYDLSQEYPIALLRFILDKSGARYNLEFSDLGITTQTREIALIKANDLSVGWYGTSAELEQELLPIRFPIWRGLLGYRIFIIRKDSQPLFDQVGRLEDLQRFTGEQGIGWTDVKILEHSGLKQDATQYDLIFEKINAGRSDYFARGITEAFREVALRQIDFPALAVEKHLLLVYPFAGFFFVNRENEQLAKALNEGFQKAYEDGSFVRFFYSHPAVKSVLEKANIDGRVRIDIPNPLLTPETRAIPDRYWHNR